jgi:cell division septation protein DedD
LTTRLLSPLTLSGRFQRTRLSLSEDSRTSSLAQVRAQAQGTYRSLQLNGTLSGRLQNRGFFRERSLGFAPSVYYSGTRYRARVEIGKRLRSLGREERFENYSLLVSRSIGSLSLQSQLFWERVFHTDAVDSEAGANVSPTSSRGLLEDRLRFSPSVQTRLSDRATLTVRGSLNKTFADRFRDDLSSSRGLSLSAQTDLKYEFDFGHSLRLRGRLRQSRRSFSFRSGSYVQFSYSLPLSIPTPSTFDSAEEKKLKGKVIDFQTGEPIEGVRVRLGRARRLTGSEGEFSIPLPESPMRIQIRGLGIGRVLMTDLSVPISTSDLGPALTTESGTPSLTIPVANAAELTVQVSEFGHPTKRSAFEGEEPERLGPLPGVLVSIRRDSKGKEARIRRTGPDGRLQVDDLPPGEWTVRLLPSQIPDGKEPSPDSIEISLSLGQDSTVALRVSPSTSSSEEVKQGASFPIQIENTSSSSPSASSDSLSQSTSGPKSSNTSTGPTGNSSIQSSSNTSSSDSTSSAFGAPSPPSREYALVVGSFAQREKAKSLQWWFRARLDSTALIRIINSKVDGRSRRRVLVGRFSSEEEAQSHLENRRELFPDHAWILPLSPAYQLSDSP